MKKQKRSNPAPTPPPAPKKRKRRSARHYTLYYILALVLLLAVGVTMSLTVLFKIAAVTVVGNTVYADEELVAASGIVLDTNLILAPTSRAEENLLAQYPYIEEVSVRRRLPDTVVINVTIAEGAAALRGEDGRYVLASRTGRVLESDLPLCPEGLITTDGISMEKLNPGESVFKKTVVDEKTSQVKIKENETEREKFEVLMTLTDELKRTGLYNDIRVIDISDTLDIRLLYDGRLAVLLGGSLDIAYKTEFAAAAIAREVTERTVGVLDVSEKPAAHLREYDIYSQEEWPFADDLRGEYERRIEKPVLPLPESEEQPTQPAAPPAAEQQAPVSAPAEPEAAPSDEEESFADEAPIPVDDSDEDDWEE